MLFSLTPATFVKVVNHTAFHYEDIQTPTAATLKSQGKTLLKHYADVLIERRIYLIQLSDILAVDAYFSKCSFVNGILQNSTSFLAFVTMLLCIICTQKHPQVSVADHYKPIGLAYYQNL